MESKTNEEKALNLLGEYLAAERALKTGKDLLSEHDYDELEIVMNNIDVIANGLADGEIEGKTDNHDLTDEERLARQKEIRSSTLNKYTELIEAYKNGLAGNCDGLQKMRDELFENL